MKAAITFPVCGDPTVHVSKVQQRALRIVAGKLVAPYISANAARDAYLQECIVAARVGATPVSKPKASAKSLAREAKLSDGSVAKITPDGHMSVSKPKTALANVTLPATGEGCGWKTSGKVCGLVRESGMRFCAKHCAKHVAAGHAGRNVLPTSAKASKGAASVAASPASYVYVHGKGRVPTAELLAHPLVSADKAREAGASPVVTAPAELVSALKRNLPATALANVTVPADEHIAAVARGEAKPASKGEYWAARKLREATAAAEKLARQQRMVDAAKVQRESLLGQFDRTDVNVAFGELVTVEIGGRKWSLKPAVVDGRTIAFVTNAIRG